MDEEKNQSMEESADTKRRADARLAFEQWYDLTRHTRIASKPSEEEIEAFVLGAEWMRAQIDGIDKS